MDSRTLQNVLNKNIRVPDAWRALALFGGGVVGEASFTGENCMQWYWLTTIDAANARVRLEAEMAELKQRQQSVEGGLSTVTRAVDAVTEKLNKVASLQASGMPPECAPDWFHLGASGGRSFFGKQFTAEHCFEEGLQCMASAGACITSRELNIVALEMCSDNFVAWSVLGQQGGGIVHEVFHSPAECFQKCLSLNEARPDDWLSLAELGGGIVSEQHYSPAQCAEVVVTADITNPESWIRLGSYGGGVIAGRDCKAKTCCMQALPSDADRMNALYGGTAESIRPIIHALLRDSTDPELWIMLGAQDGGSFMGKMYNPVDCCRSACSRGPCGGESMRF